MAPLAALSMARHESLLRAAQVAGHAFAHGDEAEDRKSEGAATRLLTIAAVSLTGFVASCGVLLILS